MPDFLSVADAASLPPGHGRTVNVRGREFALFNLDGTFCALDDACPHAGASLGAGTLEDGCIHCPLHGWMFDAQTGACLNNPARPVRTYPTRVVNGQVELLVDEARPAG